MNRSDFQKLAETRVEEATVLFSAKKYSGAYYLAGYAVECALKACVARRTKRWSFPDKNCNKCYTHDLKVLLELAGLNLQGADLNLMRHWAIAKDWNEEARYQKKSKTEAEAIVAAINDPGHGVLTWIRSHW